MTDDTEPTPADDGQPEKNESNDSGGSLSPEIEQSPEPEIAEPAPEIAEVVIEASEGEHVPFVASPDRYSQAPEVGVDAEGKSVMTGRMLYFDKSGTQVS